MKSGGGFNLYVFSFQKLGVDNHFSEYVWKRLKPPPCWHTTVYQVLNYHYNDQWDDWYERQLQVLGPISSSECLFNLSEWFLPSTAGNPKYICTQSTPNQCTVLMLFMSFVLWEQKVFFSCTFYAATIYIYTHNSGISCGECFFYQWKVIMILCHRAQRHGWMNWPVCHSEGIPCTHFAETARQWLVYDWCVFKGKGPWNSSGFIGFIVHTDFLYICCGGKGLTQFWNSDPQHYPRETFGHLTFSPSHCFGARRNQLPTKYSIPRQILGGCNRRFVGALYSLFLGNVPPGINAIIKQFRWRWKTGWMIGHLYRTVIIDVYLFSTLRFCWFVSVLIVPVTRRGGCMFGSSFSTGCFLHQDNHPSSATWKTSYQRFFPGPVP